MQQTLGSAPGIKLQPSHRIAIEKASARWQVHIGDVLLADSQNALVVNETNYSPAIYFPVADVFSDNLQAVDIKTSCPFKGEASYFRLASDPHGDVVAWTYPNTYDDVAEIRGYVAFYPDRVMLSGTQNSN